MRKSSFCAATLALVLATAACGGDDEGSEGSGATTAATQEAATTASGAATSSPAASAASGPASGEPYVFGSLIAASGPLVITGQDAGLNAWIADYNERGGFQGRPLELKTFDAELANPEKAAAGARQLVDQDNVISIVGSSSFADCAVNAAFYEAKGVAVLNPAYDSQCTQHSITFPVTQTVDYVYLGGMRWAAEQQAKTKFAYIATDSPGERKSGEALAQYAPSIGAEVVNQDYLTPTSTDVVGPVVRAKEAGADAVILSMDPARTSALLTEAANQGIGIDDGVIWIASPVAYFPEAGQVFGPVGEGMYVQTVTAPFEGDDAEADKIATKVEEMFPDQSLDGFVPLGWQAGLVLEQVLGQVDGELTRESFLAAAQSMASVDQVLNPEPIDWSGTPKLAQPSVVVLELTGGAWQVASDGFVVAEIPGN